MNFRERKKAKLRRRGEEDRNFFGEEEEEIEEFVELRGRIIQLGEEGRNSRVAEREKQRREAGEEFLFIYFLVFLNESAYSDLKKFKIK